MKLNVTNQKIEVTDASLVVSGSIKQYTCECSFDESWDGYGNTAVFRNLSHDTAYEAPIVDGSCIIPYEVIKDDGFLLIGIYGVVGSSEEGTYKRRPTVWADAISVSEGCNEGVVVPDPTESVYDQIMAAIGEVDAKLDEILPQVETLVDEAKGYAESASGSAASASESAASASKTASDLHTYVDTKEAEIATEVASGISALEAKENSLEGDLNALKTTLAGELSTQQTEISEYLDNKESELASDLDAKEASLETKLSEKESAIEQQLDTKGARYVEQAKEYAASASTSASEAAESAKSAKEIVDDLSTKIATEAEAEQYLGG